MIPCGGVSAFLFLFFVGSLGSERAYGGNIYLLWSVVVFLVFAWRDIVYCLQRLGWEGRIIPVLIPPEFFFLMYGIG